jgi:hypothetical protein
MMCVAEREEQTSKEATLKGCCVEEEAYFDLPLPPKELSFVSFYSVQHTYFMFQFEACYC